MVPFHALTLLLLLALLHKSAHAGWIANTTQSLYTVYVAYATPFSSLPIIHTITDDATKSLYLIQAIPLPLPGAETQPVVKHVVGRTVSYHPIVVGPRGCSDTNPALATETSNCAYSAADAQRNRDGIKKTWWMSALDPRCAAAGGSAQVCLGPFAPVTKNTDYFSLETPAPFNPADLPLGDLVFNYGGFLLGWMGPFGNIRAPVKVDYVRGYVNISSTSCV